MSSHQIWADSSVELLALLEHLDYQPNLFSPQLFGLCILKPEHNRVDVGAIKRLEERLRLFVLLECFDEILGQFRSAGRAVCSVPPTVFLRLLYLLEACWPHSSL